VQGTLLRVTLVLMLLALAVQPADAHRRRRAVATAPGPRFGPHLGYNFDVDELLLGAQLSWPIATQIDLYPTFDYYFVSPGSLWALNVDLKYRPPTRYGVWYVGGGLNLLKASGGSDTNLNLLTGLEGRRGRTRPYVEAKFILGNGSAFQLVGGFSWRSPRTRSFPSFAGRSARESRWPPRTTRRPPRRPPPSTRRSAPVVSRSPPVRTPSLARPARR